MRTALVRMLRMLRICLTARFEERRERFCFLFLFLLVCTLYVFGVDGVESASMVSRFVLCGCFVMYRMSYFMLCIARVRWLGEVGVVGLIVTCKPSKMIVHACS